MDQTNPNTQSAPSGDKKNTGMAVLAYIVFFVPLLTKSADDPFVKYHVKQGLVLFLFGLVGLAITRVLPYIGMVLEPILDLLIIIWMIMGIMNALNGQEKPLPVIGKYSDTFKF